MLQFKKLTMLMVSQLLLALMAFGQAHFGVQAGAGVSNLIYKVPVDNPPNPVAVFHLGGMVEFGATEGLAFSTGLHLSGKGAQGLPDSIQTEGYNREINKQAYFLQIPAKAILHGNGIYGAIGPYAAFGLFGNSKTTFDPKTDAFEKKTESRSLQFGKELTDDFSPVEFGATIEFGYESKNGVRILLHYQHGFSDLRPSKYQDVKGSSKIHSYSVGLTVGYMFNYGGM